MLHENLYVYGVVKSDLDWKETGLCEKEVFLVNQGKFSALVHNNQEKPYTSSDPNEIRDLILAHNEVLDRAMKTFNGIIPLHFNTIIKRGKNSPQENLKKWLNDDQEKLEKIWNKIKNKKEYGLRVYYDKNKLVEEISNCKEVKKIKEIQQGKSRGINYLLQEKANSKSNEFTHNKINQFKQKFYDELNKIVAGIKVNISRIHIGEEKDLLLSLSVLVDEFQIDEVKKILEKESKEFPFHLAGPFAPYSFVEDETV